MQKIQSQLVKERQKEAIGQTIDVTRKEVKYNTQEERTKRARSLERNSIKLAFSGMSELEYEYFEELLKQTMKSIQT